MKEATKTMYKCDHCNKWYQRKHACINHEEICFNNPENSRPCFSCHYLEKVKYDLFYDTFNGESKREIEIFQCQKTKKYLHTPQNEIKNNMYELGNDLNESMPRNCYLFNNDFNLLITN